MATRSFIGKLNHDGTVAGVYCHYDGYPEGVGRILKNHYTDLEKIDELLALGSISNLGPEIGEAHDFDSAPETAVAWTTAYHRDRGEELEPADVYPDVVELVKNAREDFGAEWVYVFQYDGWRTYEVP